MHLSSRAETPRVWVAALGILASAPMACGDDRGGELGASVVGLQQPLHEADAAEAPQAEASAPQLPGNGDAALQAPTDGDAAVNAATYAYMFACEHDDDCIAVPKAGWCRNGIKEAVNRRHLDAYKATFGQSSRGACTFLLIRDRRVAHCDKAAGRCSLAVRGQKPGLPAVFVPPQ